MLQQKLNDLRDYILNYNKYLNKGYSDVFMDTNTGIVHNDAAIFPNDTEGDFFYLRLPNNIGFNYDRAYTISDSQNGVGINSNIVLVAFMKNAKADILLSNIVNTIRTYNTPQLKLVSATHQRDVVVLQELARTSEEVIEAALQRMPDFAAIVSVTFQISIPMGNAKIKCFETPCA